VTPLSKRGEKSPERERNAKRIRKGNYHYALVLHKQGDHEQAVRELLNCEPTTSTLALLTKAYADSGDFDAALACSNRLVEADTLRAESYYLQATILLERNRNDEAMPVLRRALFLAPGLILAHVAMANVQRNRGKIQNARRHLDNALTLLQNLPDDNIVAESGGLPAGRLREMILLIKRREYTE
ncbi:MAG: tetratricopeptide repeat protein, partial [Chitinivibrionales bacterium]|nr:tetratricopeptide repeat protein [Chitinivibrionales bacterium]